MGPTREINESLLSFFYPFRLPKVLLQGDTFQQIYNKPYLQMSQWTTSSKQW